MRSVILFIELLRTKPSGVFWAAVLAQAALWWLVPALFYAAPPEGLAEVLAIGREFQLGSGFGPPLAYLMAEAVFAGAGLVGVYLFSQFCVVTAFWAVFTLGRIVVGDRQAALAVLLMVGVFAFSVPTPDFGPNILAMPFWALALLHYWRAVGQMQRRYWLVLGLDLGLLMLTSYAGFVLFILLFMFTLTTARGRAQFLSVEPWIGGIVGVLLLFPHLIWLDQNGGLALASLAAIEVNLRAWVPVILTLIAGHVGLLALIVIGQGSKASRRAPAPEIRREPVDPVARRFVQALAIAPLLLSAALALFGNGAHGYVTAPLVLLSALAVVVTAPDRIRIVQQRLVAIVWAALLILPPLGVVAAVTVLPWLYPTELKVTQPATEIGKFFGENFQRRTNQPLAIVAGDARLAELIALAAPSRPSLYLDATPEQTPWVTPQQIAAKGVLVVWPAGETRLPPTAIRERFPGLTAESPQVFVRRVQGRLPPIRIGWAVIGPRATAALPLP